jgi:glycosyltransferase involved in cell wall biosynthesis
MPARSNAVGKTHYLFMMDTDQLGGAEYRLIDYCKFINYEKYRVTVGLRKDLFSDNLGKCGVNVDFTPLPRLDPRASSYRKFREFYSFLKRIHPEAVVFSQFWLSSFSLPELIAGYIAAKGQVYMIVHDNTIPYPKYKSRLHFGFIPGIGWKWRQERFFQRALVYFTKKVLAVSQAAKTILETVYRYPSSKIRVAYLGVDLDRFSPAAGKRKELRRIWEIPDNDQIIISASRIDTVKRFDRLIEAFTVIAQKRADVWLVIAGTGPKQQEVKDLAGLLDSSIKNRIKFLGFATDIVPILQAGDIFVLASDSEGFPRALVEALAAGLVTVATDCGGTAEIIKDKLNGFLVAKSSAGVIKGLTEALTLTNGERAKIIKTGKDYIKNNCDLKENIKDSLNILGMEND